MAKPRIIDIFCRETGINMPHLSQSMKKSLSLTVLLLLVPLLVICTNINETTNNTYSINEKLEISNDELTIEQHLALAGTRVSSGNWLHHVGGIGADQGTIARVGA
ncbi:MAG: hypothetical protein QF807_05455, partial [Candidatus Thalassarchaeaceae archaeon]|nr:hypothetical protein [Candidatus Thalassarchaeaceae archaeon]